MGHTFPRLHSSLCRRLTIIGLAGLAALPWIEPLTAADAPAWWDAQWTVRKKITLDTTATGAPLTEATGASPVLLRLHSGNFQFAAARDDGADLRFVAEDGKTVLSHHIERYDGLMGEAFVWVRVPEVKAGAQTTLWLYSGNPEPKATAVVQPKATYDEDTVLVYHFAERGAPAVDSSGNGNVALNAGTTVDGSMIGGGIRLDGRNGLSVAPSASLTWGGGAGLTWSAWIKPGDLGADAVIFSQRDGGNAFVIGLNAGVPYVEITGAAGAQRSPAGPPLATGAWRHLAVAATPTTTTLYLDGEPYGTLAAGLPALNGSAGLGVAVSDPAAAATGFVGEIDELTISRVPRPAAFIKLAALSQGADKSSKLITVGADEQAGHEGAMAEISKHLSLFTEISKSLTFDGWVVIGLCTILAILGWIIAIAKYLYLNKIKKASAAFLRNWEALSADLTVLDHGDDDNIRSMGGQASAGAQKVMKPSPLYHLYQIGSQEIHNRVTAAKNGFEGLSSRSITAIRATLDGGLTREIQKLHSQLVFLTIGIAGGPYLGLLGTVIGVMITFAVIARSGEVEINSIAPGIAGALLATVAGLAVAIPALFAYSYLSSRIKDAISDMHVFIDEFVAKIAESYPARGE